MISHSTPEFLRAFNATYVPKALTRGDGKVGRDYIDGFTHPEEAVIWQVRVHKKTAFKLGVRYTTLDPHCKGTYSIFVNGKRYTHTITPAKSLLEPTEDVFEVEIEGEKDIVFRPETINGEFLQLYGVSLIPQDKELAETVHVEEDTTDLGDK